MIEEKETYTKEEVKKILSDMIERNGYDSAAICHWAGLNRLTVDEWNEALYQIIGHHHEYGKRLGIYGISQMVQEKLDSMPR